MSTAFPSASASKDEELERKLKLLVNADLREICRDEGLPVSGRKADLQQRILDRLSRYVSHGDYNGLTMLKFRINNPQASLKGVSPPIVHPNSSPYATPGFSPNSSARFSSPAHGRLNGAANMGRSILPPIKFKPSPFYDLRQCVGQCRLPLAADYRNTATARVELAPRDLESLRMNSSYRILLLCGEMFSGQSSAPVDIAFPVQVELRVNDQEVKCNTKGVKNKPGSTKPVDITPFIRKQSGSPSNSVSISYTSGTKGYAVVVFLASKVAMAHLTGLIKNGRMISKNQVLAEMRSRQEDDDIVATSSIMSLKDPVSQMRIKTPCRGYKCTHIQCFDAETYLQMQEQAPLWACSICNKPTPFEDVAVDQYVREILAATESPTGITQVSIEPDGSWKVEAPKANGKRKRSRDSADSNSDNELMIVPPRKTNVKVESMYSPYSPAPALSVSASSTGRSHSISTATPKSKKRPSVVIDLTLSDDDEPPPQQQASRNPYVSSKPRSHWSVSFPVPAPNQNSSPPSNIFMNQTYQLPNPFQPQVNSRSSMENDVWGLLDPRSPVWPTFTPPENHPGRNGG